MPPFVPRKRPISSEIPEKHPNKRPAIANAVKRKPDLFDTLDQVSTSTQTVADNEAYLQSKIKDEESDSSSLSDADSDEFEDVLKAHPQKEEEEEEEEDHWEDALSPKAAKEEALSSDQINAAPLQDLQITIGAQDGATINYSEEMRKKGPTKIERQIRVSTHCLHVQFLLWHNVVRNGWTRDKEVQDILLGQLPQGIWKEVERWRVASGLNDSANNSSQNGGNTSESKMKNDKKSSRGKKSRDWGESAEQLQKGVPNMVAGDPLIRLLKYVAAYWKKRFKTTAPGLRKQGYKPIPVLEQELKKFQKGRLPQKVQGERIRDLDDFRNLARKCQGSRDVGAQLFTALLRGLGLEARLVANLQPAGFGWGKNEDAVAGKDSSLSDSEGQARTLGSIQGRQDLTKPGQNGSVRLSPCKPKNVQRNNDSRKVVVIDSDSSSDLSSVHSSDVDSVAETISNPEKRHDIKKIDRDLPFPHYWTEALSPVTNTYIPVDPLVLCTVAATPDLLSSFEPRGTKADNAKEVIAYVIAHSADGSAKDVTVRYLKKRMLPGKTKGARLPPERVPIYNKRGKVKRYEQYDWFKTVMSGYERRLKERTSADDLEESTDLQPSRPEQRKKPADETLQGYKNSAEFVLERHLKREEALLPSAKPVRNFTSGKGDKLKSEPVYRRADVVQCKSVETWHKEGREIKHGEQPLKLVPTRAVTLMRKREIEEAERDSGEKVKQGLYTKSQTQFIIPPPIENGIVPKNAFGNIDIYVPTMVPSGAIHIPRRGTVKICKRLGINFAEACIGFEFGNKRAVPILHGVVIPVEHERSLIDAWEAERLEIQKKEKIKREQRILTTWKKFCKGLLIISRMEESYGQDDKSHIPDEVNPMTNKKLDTSRKGQGAIVKVNGSLSVEESKDFAGGFLRDNENDEDMSGGFIVDDVPNNADLMDVENPAVDNEQAPMSFQLSHQNYVDVDADLNAKFDHEKMAENGVHKTNGVNKREVSKEIPSGSKRNRKPRGKIKQKSEAGSDQTAQSNLAKTPIGYVIASDGEDAKSNVEVGVQHQSPGSKSGAKASKVKKPLRRAAARKSQEAVRSHYFEHSSEDD